MDHLIVLLVLWVAVVLANFGVVGLIQDFTISGLVDAAAEKVRVAQRGSYALRNFSAARRHLDLTNDSRSNLQVAAGSAGSSNGN